MTQRELGNMTNDALDLFVLFETLNAVDDHKHAVLADIEACLNYTVEKREFFAV